MAEALYHRFRFYPRAYSTFDTVEPCTKGTGKGCIGCQFGHALCDQNGRVLDPEAERAKMAAEPKMK